MGDSYPRLPYRTFHNIGYPMTNKEMIAKMVADGLCLPRRNKPIRRPRGAAVVRGRAPRLSRPRLPETFVYVMWDGARRVKIGVTNNPLRRWGTLIREEKCEFLTTVCCMHGDRVLEKRLHAAFEHAWLGREWFGLTDDLRQFIAVLCKCEQWRPWWSATPIP